MENWEKNIIFTTHAIHINFLDYCIYEHHFFNHFTEVYIFFENVMLSTFISISREKRTSSK
jgi:hypothetical protein